MMERACLPEPPWLLLDGDVLPGLGFPVLGEGGVELDVQLPRGVVGDVEQGYGGCLGLCDRGHKGRKRSQ